jgi:hypothetical protein
MHVVNPKFVTPSRRKVENTISSSFNKKRKVLRTKLALADSVSLTFDTWSDRIMRSYLGITVHMLTDNMIFEGFLSDMVCFSGSHAGENIATHVLSVFGEFDRRRKICYIITNNASNTLKAIRDMSELLDEQSDDDGGNAEPPQDVVQDTAGEVETDETEIEDDSVTDVNDSEQEVNIVLDDVEPLTRDSLESVLINLVDMTKLRLSCGIHSLQLVICDGLKTAKFMSSVLSETSRLSTRIHTSGMFSTKFLKPFKTTVPCTNTTRWNSIYIQLFSVSKLTTQSCKCC